MANALAPIYFYIPEKDWPTEALPNAAEHYWQWQNATQGVYRSGKYNWTLQTYLNLQEHGFPSQLVNRLPLEGIVVAHRDFFPFDLQPSANVLLVCIQADRPEHPYAQVHIVQNPQDRKLGQLGDFWKSYYMPYWPQPGLIPRDSTRGDRFENAAYFGIRYNLAPELKDPTWQKQLQAIGLNWQVIKPENWNDYSNVDVVIGVRSFEYQGNYLWKPPSKLVNAWHAGVPAILGHESAFKAQRQSDLDYLEATSPNDILRALEQLRDNVELRHAIVKNGFWRAQTTHPSKLAKTWCKFLTEIATPAYEHWVSTPKWGQQMFLQRRYLEIKANGVRRRLKSFISTLPENGNWN